MPVTKIISGGQTGADRGGLDAAIYLGLSLGGHCPAGRRAEDGLIPSSYPLVETKSSGYSERTSLNVKNSDVTVIFTRGPLTPGSALTLTEAKRIGRPSLHLDVDDETAPDKLRKWLGAIKPSILNVAGSRESKAPGISGKVQMLLRAVLKGSP